MFVMTIPALFAAEPLALEIALDQARALGAERSSYRHTTGGKAEATKPATSAEAPKARLGAFRTDIAPLLNASCVTCHGPDKQKADFRIDTLDPDLLTGDDVSWWLEVVDVLSNGEMPPAKKDVTLADADRARIIDWLSGEIQTASQVRRAEAGHSSFRRMTRYETNYALQDLLGLEYDFAADLPPETRSEDGFENSSEMLHVSTMQFELYRELGRAALQKATVRGEQPAAKVFRIDMAERAAELTKDAKEKDRRKSTSTSRPHYLQTTNGTALANDSFNYRGRTLVPEEAEKPWSLLPPLPPPQPVVLVVPGRQRVSWPLGPELAERGDLRIRVRAARGPSDEQHIPTLRLLFGFQASNNSRVTDQIGAHDFDLDGPPGELRVYDWSIPLSEIDRNPYRGKRRPKVNSNESIVLENLHSDSDAHIHIESVDVLTPYYAAWPPASHRRVLLDDSGKLEDAAYRRRVFGTLMRRAWRRPITSGELDRKAALYDAVRPACEDAQEAVIEVLSTVLASPHFLYLAPPGESDSFGLASRLAIFLWSSLPDEELLQLAADQQLERPEVLERQVERMLADPRAERFSRHFVRQWLGMQLLDYLRVDPKARSGFDMKVRSAMQREPVAFFAEVLNNNQSIVDFLHADFAMVNRDLAPFYGLSETNRGTTFERVALDDNRRGGLLTQAGLLAMNSDGTDSHPLKRGIWLLENILNDPPPPPPPSVPEIDLADPEIPPAHRPVGDRVRKLRRARPLARQNRPRAGRRDQHAVQPAGTGRDRGPQTLPPAHPPRPVCPRLDPQTRRLRARPPDRVRRPRRTRQGHRPPAPRRRRTEIPDHLAGHQRAVSPLSHLPFSPFPVTFFIAFDNELPFLPILHLGPAQVPARRRRLRPRPTGL